MDAAGVRALLARFGRTDTDLRRPSGGAIANPPQPWKPGAAASDPTVAAGFPAVVLSVAEARMEPSKLTPGTTAVGYVSGAESAPTIGDLLTVGARRYAVLGLDTLDPAGAALLYTLHLEA